MSEKNKTCKTCGQDLPDPEGDTIGNMLTAATALFDDVKVSREACKCGASSKLAFVCVCGKDFSRCAACFCSGGMRESRKLLDELLAHERECGKFAIEINNSINPKDT